MARKKLTLGKRYIVATAYPAALSTPNTRFTYEADLRWGTALTDVAALKRTLATLGRFQAARTYEAEYLGPAEDGRPLFKPVARLRLTESDHMETADDGSAPGIEEVVAFLNGDIECLTPTDEPSPPAP